MPGADVGQAKNERTYFNLEKNCKSGFVYRDMMIQRCFVMLRPLGTMLSAFEHDSDGEWNCFGLIPLREALHSNRWKQPEPEQVSGDFLAKQKTSQNFLGSP